MPSESDSRKRTLTTLPEAVAHSIISSVAGGSSVGMLITDVSWRSGASAGPNRCIPVRRGGAMVKVILSDLDMSYSQRMKVTRSSRCRIARGV
jgi:hypothetical protein